MSRYTIRPKKGFGKSKVVKEGKRGLPTPPKKTTKEDRKRKKAERQRKK